MNKEEIDRAAKAMALRFFAHAVREARKWDGAQDELGRYRARVWWGAAWRFAEARFL